MFYSLDLLKIQKNRKGRLPKCWLAATIKNFVGSGFHKLTKVDIATINIGFACDDILEGTVGNATSNRFSLYLSSQLFFGAIKIFRDQVLDLEGHCEQLYYNVITHFTKSEDKKSRKTIVTDLTLMKDTEIEPVDLTCLFVENEVDRHLINDETPVRFQTDLDFHNGFDSIDDIRRISSIPPLNQESSFLHFYEAINMTNSINEEYSKIEHLIKNGSEMKTPVTPKRKCDQKNMTPTKKNRKMPSSSIPHPKKSARRSLSSFSNPSELARSPVAYLEARRSIFNDQQIPVTMDADPATSGCIPIDESTSAIEPGVLRKSTFEFSPPRNTTGMPQPYENMDEALAPPQISDESNVILTTTEESFLEQKTKNTGIKIIKDIILARNYEQTKATNSPSSRNVTNLQLQEFNEDTELKISNSPYQRKRKNIQVFDNAKQICLIEPKSNWVYTRSMISTQPKVDKISAKLLFTLPATRLKNEVNLNKNCWSWAKNLEFLFFNMIQTPCKNVFDIYRESEPGDANLIRNTSLLDFKGRFSKTSFKQIQSGYSSSKSTLNSKIGEDKQRVSSDEDIILMPPPLPIVEPSLEMQIDEPEQRFNPDELQITSPIHTNQIHESNNNVYQSESITKCRKGLQTLTDSDESFLLKVPNYESSNESSSTEYQSEHEHLIVTIEEFSKLLEEMWLIASNYLRDEEQLLEIELTDILSVEDASIEEMLKYFFYCCELEMKLKLSLEQDNAYGIVRIIKIVNDGK